MPRPLTDPAGEPKQRLTIFLTPRHIAKMEKLRRPGETVGTLICRLLDRVPEPPKDTP